MNSEASGRLTRRDALARGAAGVAAMAAGVTGAAGAEVVREENPWRYDVDQLRRVDPALVQYRETRVLEVAQGPARRLAFAEDGELHVAAGRRWLVASRDGSWRRDIAVGDVLRCVRPWGKGRAVLAFKERVEVWDAESGRVVRWPAFPGKPFLTGLAVTEREIFVADSGNRVVFRCDWQGRVELRLGERQEDRHVPGLVLPSPFLDVEMGADGLIRVNNPGRHRVETYTRDGDLEASWGRAGVGPEAFCGCCNPVAIALLPDGRCVTAEKGLPRVKVYRPDGTLESFVAVPDAFGANTSDARGRGREGQDAAQDGLDVAVDGRGTVAVLDLISDRIHFYQRREA
ncbi:MAG: hypothetical protein IT580_22340 [Verrucomicrobiales bacterium]|nr:hypothetical protein [Verrucomicrobiales bacterium]